MVLFGQPQVGLFEMYNHVGTFGRRGIGSYSGKCMLPLVEYHAMSSLLAKNVTAFFHTSSGLSGGLISADNGNELGANVQLVTDNWKGPPILTDDSSFKEQTTIAAAASVMDESRPRHVAGKLREVQEGLSSLQAELWLSVPLFCVRFWL
ncbi:hypothetical protein Ancab_024462 [Ancistrocladus abbreviatus]